ncbi:hypothetical protein HOU41_gp126 [Proteus phage Stubb]|uniref:Uncharacterized protein n=1 Tax=Proteus phage Stubb TaxID=2315597 RepID=A0A3B8DXB5_9CAUD|nr:hypothetical protein HOU41_gp126 [Proteus phage Stubb]AYJ73218.1 hypothetical protein CPT_Stubb_102 [Proteus phage Stubb]
MYNLALNHPVNSTLAFYYGLMQKKVSILVQEA